MNIKMMSYVLSRVVLLEAALMLLPMAIAIYYGEASYMAFVYSISILLAFAILLSIRKVNDEDTTIYAREGFVTVGLSWVVLSAFGALPFVLSGFIPNYIDAFFETVSGFTTTGASILTNVEALDNGLLFWRSFTHWIGGMGVLVFILAILPISKNNNMHLMRAEVPGPSVGKLVPKMKSTAKILYLIYFGLTVIEIVILIICGMPLFDAVVHTFGTAGTGGFGIKNTSIGYYDSTAIDYVIGTFMILFGINFNMYYYILIGRIKDVLDSEELKTYLSVIIVAVALITINIIPFYGNVFTALRYAYFQVGSIITTTGYSTYNYELWPAFSKTIIVLLMFCGACAGSTGGGIKIGRLIILLKQQFAEVRHMVNSRQVHVLKLDGKVVDREMLTGAQVFFTAFMVILLGVTLLVSLDGFDFTTNFTAVLSCISNIGPGLNLVGPAENFSLFSNMSKIFLSFTMLAGRLEIFPILILFNPKLYKK